MTVAQLIEELNRQPAHLPVKVLLSKVFGARDERGEWNDGLVVELSDEDAIEAHIVRFEGSYVMIESK